MECHKGPSPTVLALGHECPGMQYLVVLSRPLANQLKDCLDSLTYSIWIKANHWCREGKSGSTSHRDPFSCAAGIFHLHYWALGSVVVPLCCPNHCNGIKVLDIFSGSDQYMLRNWEGAEEKLQSCLMKWCWLLPGFFSGMGFDCQQSRGLNVVALASVSGPAPGPFGLDSGAY